MLPQEHQAVDDGRHEIEGQLDFPIHAHFVVEKPANHHAEDHAGGPGSVENIEVVRAVVREQRRDQRIRHRFQRAVGEGENKHADDEHLIGIAGVRGAEGHERGQHVHRKRRDH